MIRYGVMLYVRYPLSRGNVEDLLHERGIDIRRETVRLWVDRFGSMFTGEVRKRRLQAMRRHTHWRWHLDAVYVRIDGVQPRLAGTVSLVLSEAVQSRPFSAETDQTD